ncbi:MAG: replicative DNA helicase [Fibrobacteres bacterium]|nr:replicative DNA helicase [Fibrobacterota bacterium]
MSDNLRQPPQAMDIEQKVLGAMLQSPEAAGEVLEVLKTEDFYREVHSLIFDAMRALYDRSEPIDVTMTANELAKTKQLELIGGEVYLMELVEISVTPANAGYHAQIIKDKAILRNLINAATGIMNKAYDGSDESHAIVEQASAEIFNISQGKVKNKFESVKDLLPHTFQEIEKYGQGTIVGIPTGFKDFDDLTAGLQRSDLIILAGRPAMGKTAIALNMAANAAILGKAAVAIFSLEMAKNQLVQRLLCTQARINMHQLRTGRLPTRDFAKLSLGAGPLYDARIFIDDSSDISILDIRAKARRLKAQGNLDLLVIDYLQLVSGGKKTDSREQEISYISRSLKGLAKELDVPVIALSQLARRAESREEGRPQLADLRESGAIEQDADMVIFIYREEVYNKSAEPGKGEIIIGKQRNGPIGTVNVSFIRDWASYENYTPRTAEESGF